MWVPFNVDNCNYMIKCKQAEHFVVYLTDMKQIWFEDLSNNYLFERYKELNPMIECDSLCDNSIQEKIASLINEINDESNINVLQQNNQIITELKCTLPEFSTLSNFKLKYRFIMSLGDQNMYFNEFTLPLTQTVCYLEIRQKKLVELLKNKDKEIQEHELGGSELATKSLVTKKFDGTKLHDNVPNDLFIKVFSRSNAFFQNFIQTFGTSILKANKIQ